MICSESCYGYLPCLAEANVGHGHAAIHEVDGETCEGQQPIEDLTTLWSQVDVTEETDNELDGDDRKGTTGLIDVSEDLRGHTWEVLLAYILCLSLSTTHHLQPTLAWYV